ncbi:hypothetical protein JDV02_002112 [Purpureocillium takamizusanense]|uniref:Uncharacterized protein n=1 Tax=Purpureocillium takamizusanense TaxID=2060973 RepID=A0A9Q8V744_9HYPO|nr:uncharacterized protein JDV02_002112 [Purpureocillium takamizusanense]UNI15590.1 hypothetical protein JDV02_002112 [Purpureocillium takamizusanense]
MTDFSHTLATLQHCVVCGSEISLTYAARPTESWKAHAQPLEHASPPSVPRVPQALVPPGLCSHTFEGQEARLVHAACWHVVARLWGKTEFTAAELDGFLDCARDASPFLPEIRFREAPDRFDVTVDHTLDADDLEGRTSRAETDAQRRFEELCAGLKDEGIKSPVLLGLRRHPLPERLHAFVSRTLASPTDAANKETPALRFWAKVIGLLTSASAGPDAPFSQADSPSRAARVAQALRNIRHGGPSRFPHTANHDVVRANASSILLALQLIPVEDIFEADHALLDGQRPKLQRPRPEPLSSLRPGWPFRLSFLTLRREYYVDNMDFGRRFRVGMKYLRTIDFRFHDDTQQHQHQQRPEQHTLAGGGSYVVPAVRSLCGMQLVRDGIGVFAVHAKDGNDWYTVWQQDPTIKITPHMAALPTSAQWPEGMQKGDLLLVSDTVKDIAVFDQFSQYLRDSGVSC